LFPKNSGALARSPKKAKSANKEQGQTSKRANKQKQGAPKEKKSKMFRATDVVRYASGVSEATAARRVRRIARARALEMPLVGGARYCDADTAARLVGMCPRLCLSRAISARFEVVADAFAQCRHEHLEGEGETAYAVLELGARLARLEALVELVWAAVAKKSGA
jgi:hypothetical protein